MGKNLVLFLDGTSNEVQSHLSNVLKLYRMAVEGDGQHLFYDPGIGTLGSRDEWRRTPQGLETYLALATGWGLDKNILDGYEFLCRNWREGDRIFLFGFSRGSYTARALAGLIYMIGLIDPDQFNLSEYALGAYKRAARDDDLKYAWRFQRVIRSRRAPVHFLGVWDTVASILVPRRGWRLPSMAFLPYTKANPGVRVFRQAAAIDERRRMFRLYRWTDGQEYRPDPFAESSVAQDQRTVWFAGDHSDIGGGHPEMESQPSKFPLLWMAQQAEDHGLRLDQAMTAHLALGVPLPDGRAVYVAPDPKAPLHDSMRGFWKVFEWLPKGARWRRYPAVAGRSGLYLPRAEPRAIPEGAILHGSVVDRVTNTTYAPVNLPKSYSVEP